jgi:hypothetical protein
MRRRLRNGQLEARGPRRVEHGRVLRPEAGRQPQLRAEQLRALVAGRQQLQAVERLQVLVAGQPRLLEEGRLREEGLARLAAEGPVPLLVAGRQVALLPESGPGRRLVEEQLRPRRGTESRPTLRVEGRRLRPGPEHARISIAAGM